MTKRELRDALERCTRWSRALERGIERLLAAEAAGEMGERDKALEHLQHLMEMR